MLRCPKQATDRNPADGLPSGIRKANFSLLRGIWALAGLCLCLPTACLLHKNKTAAPKAVPTAVRLVLLPLNVSQEDQDMRWISMATPILMAKAAASAPDLEVVPLWQSMPVALEVLGASRTITPENAAFIATRLSAKWATQGELTPAEDDVSVLLDFIPEKSNLIPFRFEKRCSRDALGSAFSQAFLQLIRYLVLSPAANPEPIKGELNFWRELAETLDREYGWFSPADPGKAGTVVSGLAKADDHLARLLFSPTLYPSIGTQPAAASPQPQQIDSATASQGAAAVPSSPPPEAQPPAASQPGNGNPPAVPVAKPAETPVVKPPPPEYQATTPAERTNVKPSPPKTDIQGQMAGTGTSDASEADSKRMANKMSEAANPTPQREPEKAASASSPLRADDAARPRGSPAASPQACRIQVYSSRSQSDAEAVAAEFEKRGLAPAIEQADLKEKGIWYRIRLEGYKNAAAAKAEGKRLLEIGLIQDYWIVH